MKRKTFGWILSGVILFIAVITALFFLLFYTKACDFWHLTGLEEGQIEEIYISYLGEENRVPLSAGYKEGLLAALSGSELKQVKDEEQPVFESAYRIWFEIDGELRQYPFYWFSGRRPLSTLAEQNLDESTKGYASGLYEYQDRRFDVQVGDRRFHFEQARDAFWNEDISERAFKEAAAAAGRPQRYELDGYDAEGMHIIDMPTAVEGLYDEGKTAQELMEASELVIVAEWMGTVHEEPEYDLYGMDVFKPLQVWKGKEGFSQLIYCPKWQYGDRILRDGSSVVVYPPACTAIFEKNREYVLCLHIEEEKQGRPVVATLVGGRMFGAGILQNGRIYPAYNTEFHPFNGMVKP